MAGPWEQFQPAPIDAAPPAGPWQKFAPPSGTAMPAPPANDVGANVMGTASQGLSGINQGIADTLGAPVDLTNNVLGAGSDIVNAIFGTDIHPPEKPFLGSKDISDAMSAAGAIKPESSDGGQQFVRRVGEEVGGALVPELGLAGRAGRTMAEAARGLGPAAAAGAGAAAAQQVAPGNQGAEMAGELIGGVVPSTAMSVVRRGAEQVAAPTLDDLRAIKNQAYANADNLGVRYSPQAFSDLVDQIAADAAGANINAARHPNAQGVIDWLRQLRSQPGYAPSLTELDQIRQVVRRDAVDGSDAANAHFGRQVIGNIDRFIDNASIGQVASGNPADAAAAIQQARTANAAYRKTETLDDSLEKTQAQTAATGSGGNINNKVRQSMVNIAFDPKKAQGFSPDEIDQMKAIIVGSRAGNAARVAGKMAPGGNGLMTALNTGAVVSNPAMAVIPAASAVAKHFADQEAIKGAQKLRATIARGGPPVLSPFFSGQQGDALAAEAAGAVAGNERAKDRSDELKAAIMRGLN